ncbi:uncharacterized protein FOMMEDRAFT_144967 [Fomitiporia mediterranea MF3/22]|uniref:uncharacterized protein n=1 Tax=Fomitiporia mediterranea (strain MF3/22) TaxID=694068 RepID=UPI00044076E3|nr:uncharacterized protein FOMMEDRAFT_144967 [Fomitiporia mediterranea MF3/22]EJD05392.1 hypothetical protein FOMMEDRAFT_144967 [Fomitiporia mediterranea MF3/22]
MPSIVSPSLISARIRSLLQFKSLFRVSDFELVGAPQTATRVRFGPYVLRLIKRHNLIQHSVSVKSGLVETTFTGGAPSFHDFIGVACFSDAPQIHPTVSAFVNIFGRNLLSTVCVDYRLHGIMTRERRIIP